MHIKLKCYFNTVLEQKLITLDDDESDCNDAIFRHCFLHVYLHEDNGVPQILDTDENRKRIARILSCHHYDVTFIDRPF